MIFKICTKCNIKKDLNAFGKLSASKDGHRCQCKECRNQYDADARKRLTPEDKEVIAAKQKKYRVDNIKRISIHNKQYRLKNKEQIAIKNKQYRSDNKEIISIKGKLYRTKNIEIISTKSKRRYANNRKSIAAKRSAYNKLHPEIGHACRYKRRGWGIPNPINEHFKGSHLHHLHIANNHQICIYIPTDLHRSIYHAHNRPETMLKINTAVMIWYYTTEDYLKVIY